jgi:RND family efflux transporter MFP subunit
VKRLLIPSLVLAGFFAGFLLVFASYRDRLSRLFSVDYEIPVQVRTAEKVSLAHTLTARGQLEPVKEVKIVTTVPGVVKEIRYMAGDKIAAGAVVAVVEVKELAERLSVQEGAIKEAEARVKSSEEQLAAAEKKFAEVRELYQKDLIARRETEQAETAVKMARAQKEAAQAQLAQRLSMSAQTRHVLGLARVSTPVSGVVTRRWSEPGAPVAENAPILSVASGETLRILVNLKSKDTEKIRPGTAAKIIVDASPERDLRGFVTQVHDLANFAGDELSVEVEVANPGGTLKFGMPASIAFLGGERRDGLFVPKAALIQGQRGPSVYVSEGGIARLRHITPGGQRNGEIEVISGIEPGDAVVVSGTERLTDGGRVRVVK